MDVLKIEIQVFEDCVEQPTTVPVEKKKGMDVDRNLEKEDNKKKTEDHKIKVVKKDAKDRIEDWLPKVQEEISRYQTRYNEILKKQKTSTISSDILMSLDNMIQKLEEKENLLNERR